MKVFLVTCILWMTFFTGCGSLTSNSDKELVAFEKIDSIIAYKGIGDNTAAGVRYKLDQTQIKKFADDWNNSESVGPCKFAERYWLKLFDKQKVRDFWTNGDYIQDNQLGGYKIGDGLKYLDTCFKENTNDTPGNNK